MTDVTIRTAETEDHARAIEAMDEWWRGSMVSQLISRFHFVHFKETCFVAERDGQLAGFLVGFLSQSHEDEAYIHFVGVAPGMRRAGVGRKLYESFFDAARARGRRVVRSVTSPGNKESVAFHLRMGFEIEPQEHEEDGLPVLVNHDGRGGSRVLFIKRLDAEDRAA